MLSTVVTQRCIIIPIPTLSHTASALNYNKITQTMSPETPNYITQNCMHVLMSILATIITRNFLAKLKLKSLKRKIEGTHAA